MNKNNILKRKPYKKMLANVKKCCETRVGRNGYFYKEKYCDITEEDIANLFKKQNGKSFDLGIKLNLNELYSSHSPLAPSVDRIDNTKGYTKDNIVINTRFENRGMCTANPNQRLQIIFAIREAIENSNYNNDPYQINLEQYFESKS